jgi:hypothetical protein
MVKPLASRPMTSQSGDARPFFMKPIKEGTGIRLSLKFFMKHIEEGKVINNLINIGFLQSELKGRYSHIDATRFWSLIPKLALQSIIYLFVPLIC